MPGGRASAKNCSDPGGPYAMYARISASRAAAARFAAASFRKAVLRAAASCTDNGGTRRVFVCPGTDALAMTAMAQEQSEPDRSGMLQVPAPCGHIVPIDGRRQNNEQSRLRFTRSCVFGYHAA